MLGLLRGVLVIVLICIFIYACQTALSKLSSKDTAKVLSALDFSVGVPWPSFTLCIRPRTGTRFPPNWQTRDFFVNITFGDLSNWPQQDMTESVHHWLAADPFHCFTLDVEHVKMKKGQNYMGACFLLNLTKLNESTLDWILINVHDKDQYVFNLHMINGITKKHVSFIDGDGQLSTGHQMVGKQTVFQFSQQFSELQSLDHRSCDETNSKKLFQCVSDYIVSKAGKGCEISRSYNETCLDYDEHRFRNVSHSLFSSPGLKPLIDEVKCELNCRYGDYNLEEVVRHDMRRNDLMNIILLNDGAEEVMLEKEIFLYDRADFVADFGGYLGLLLGASFLSIFDGLCQACKKLGLFHKPI